MMMKQACGILNAQNVVKIFQFSYRTKQSIINGSLEERFIERVLKRNKKLKEESIPEILEKFKTIKSFGFGVSELTDCPEILKLETGELCRRFELLSSSHERDAIILPMLKYATSTSMTERSQRLLQECKMRRGVSGISRSEKLRSVLKCSEKEMLELYIRCPRIGGPRKNRVLLQKLEILLNHNARIEDIFNSINLLENIPFPTIEKRTKLLHSLGYNSPLPLGIIGRGEKVFNNIIEKVMDGNGTTQEIQKSLDVLSRITSKQERNHALYKHKKKVDYLLDAGFEPSEIEENPFIMSTSITSLKEFVGRTMKHGAEAVPLSNCNPLRSGHLSVMQGSTKKVFMLLKGHISPNVKKRFSQLLKKEPTNDMFRYCNKNMNFLITKGFTSEDISKMPLILCHEDGLLQEWWERMSLEDIQQDPNINRIKILNQLQYTIEHFHNFKCCQIQEDNEITNDIISCLDQENPASLETFHDQENPASLETFHDQENLASLETFHDWDNPASLETCLGQENYTDYGYRPYNLRVASLL